MPFDPATYNWEATDTRNHEYCLMFYDKVYFARRTHLRTFEVSFDGCCLEYVRNLTEAKNLALEHATKLIVWTGGHLYWKMGAYTENLETLKYGIWILFRVEDKRDADSGRFRCRIAQSDIWFLLHKDQFKHLSLDHTYCARLSFIQRAGGQKLRIGCLSQHKCLYWVNKHIWVDMNGYLVDMPDPIIP